MKSHETNEIQLIDSNENDGFSIGNFMLESNSSMAYNFKESLSLTIKITPLWYVLRFMCHQNENFTVFISVLLSKSSIPAQLKTKICNYIICSSMKCYRLYQITCWTKSEGNPDILALVEQNQTVGPAKVINFKKCDCIWTNEFVSNVHKVEHL